MAFKLEFKMLIAFLGIAGSFRLIRGNVSDAISGERGSKPLDRGGECSTDKKASGTSPEAGILISSPVKMKADTILD